MRLKQITASLLILLFAFSLTSCNGGKPHDFREVDFGMSIAEVSKKESAEYVYAADDFLFYNASMNGENAEVYYYFVDDKLVEAECKFIIGETTLSMNIERFKVFSNYITSLYGEPLNADYRKMLVDDLGESTGDGDHLLIYHHLIEYFQEWQTETAHITLLLNFKDEQVNYLYSAEALPTEE